MQYPVRRLPVLVRTDHASHLGGAATAAVLGWCWRMWQGAVITWDGQVVPCCFDKDAHHAMGSLHDMGLNDIWHSERYAQFRSTLFQDRSGISMCTNCSEGSHVYV